MTANDVVQRECVDKLTTQATRTDLNENREIEACRANVLLQANQMALMGHDRAQRSLDALRRLAGLLSSMPRPKTLILISGGFPPPVSTSEFSPVALALAAAQVNLYSLYLENYQYENIAAQPSPTASEDESLARFGIENMTAAAGGTLLLVTGEFEPLLDRVSRELAGAYLLGVEVEAADRDGHPHRVGRPRQPGWRDDPGAQAVRHRAGGRVVRRRQPRRRSGRGRGERAESTGGRRPGSASCRTTGFSRRPGNSRAPATSTSRSRPAWSRPGDRPAARCWWRRAIDPRSVSFVPLDGRRVAHLGIGIFCGDARHAVVGQLWQDVNFALKDDTFAKYTGAGHPLHGQGGRHRRSQRREGRGLRLPVRPARRDDGEDQVARRWRAAS